MANKIVGFSEEEISTILEKIRLISSRLGVFRYYGRDEFEPISKDVISILEKIDSIDRGVVFSNDKLRNLIEDICAAAYKLAKLEVFCLGSSEILVYAKNGKITSDAFKTEVMLDITSKERNTLADKVLRSLYESGRFDEDMLSEQLLFLLSLNIPGNNISTVQIKLLELSDNYNNNKGSISALNKEQAKLSKEKKPKFKPTKGEIISGAISAAAFLGIGHFVAKITKSSEIEENPSNYEICTTSKIVQFDGNVSGRNTHVIDYYPWIRTEDGYSRVVCRMNTDGINHANLDDYLDDDLIAKLCSIESRKEISEEELNYSEVIREAVRLIQNPDDVEIDKMDYTFRLSVALLLELSLIILINLNVRALDGTTIVDAIFRYVDDNKSSKDLKEIAKAINRYMSKNKELKERFELLLLAYRDHINKDDLRSVGVCPELLRRKK